MLQDALVLNIEQIGEKSEKLDEKIRSKHSEIDWVQIRGYRNRLVHDYEGTTLGALYQTIQDDLPALRLSLLEIQAELIKEKRPHCMRP
jgi:uncharacterized protein with HEPN domain